MTKSSLLKRVRTGALLGVALGGLVLGGLPSHAAGSPGGSTRPASVQNLLSDSLNVNGTATTLFLTSYNGTDAAWRFQSSSTTATLAAYSTNTKGVYGESGSGTGVYGKSAQTGVQGEGAQGVIGKSQSQYGFGGWFQAANGAAGGVGVFADGTTGVKARGTAVGITATGGIGVLVTGTTVGITATGGIGVQATGTTGAGLEATGVTGVSGAATSLAGPGVKGINNLGGKGVYGTSNGGYGVYGESTGSGTGVYGYGEGGVGVFGVSTDAEGVYAQSWSAAGVYGFSQNSYGVYGYSKNFQGIYGKSDTDYGVVGVSPSKAAVRAVGTSSYGLWASTSTGTGVYASTSTGTGVYAKTSSGDAALWASNATKTSGHYSIIGDGDVLITGTLHASGGIVAPVATTQGARMMYNEGATTNLFSDEGSSVLKDGRVVITIDPLYAQTVNLGAGYRVFLTPRSFDSKGLVVGNLTATSFEVREIGGGKGNYAFDWRISAPRTGYEKARLAPAPSIPAAPAAPAAESSLEPGK